MAQDDEGDPCTIVSLQDVLEEDQELESTANAVLGDSDDTKCSYSKAKKSLISNDHNIPSFSGICGSSGSVRMWDMRGPQQ